MNDGSKGPAPDSAFSPDGDPLSAVRRPRRGRTIGVIAVTAVVVGAACVTWWIGRGDGQEADAGSAGFYFQFSPTESFLGGGIWMPPKLVPAQGEETRTQHELFSSLVQ